LRKQCLVLGDFKVAAADNHRVGLSSEIEAPLG